MEKNSKNHPRVSVKIYSHEAPSYETAQASGCDLRAAIAEPMTLAPMERALLPTGIRLEIPPGFEAQIRPRSGKAWTKGLSLPNSPGTIDADYRGEIKVLCINLNTEPITINPGEKIAQLVFAPIVQAQFVRVETIGEMQQSLRQDNGFGSTGF